MWRFDIINHFINKYGYKKYLEIGVEGGDCLRAINCQVIHGVDPASPHATFKVESDTFFQMLDKNYKYDIIFIDGLHVENQVTRDIENSLKHLAEGGTIIVHDCNPPSEWHQRSYDEAKQNGCRLWNGTVWKSILYFRSLNNLEISVVDTDWGVGIIRPGSQIPITHKNYTYNEFEQNKTLLLNLISPQKFLEIY